ncbi:GH15 family glucan-1,4-alpha-glucosidase [Paenibacillus phyllosphaerae]|uniref:GH15 family glucan-1,4-alpha-glucosidase n=1 Tax=Paenibacillus phyllosphaerae TaxID=274593 RepID=A0A7W5B334_9BACL|nr:glycoside hydrolase family 15 protein [Paenibacillus phyllosphaerae]MBB3113540.1 GH15 family glucan-1,4-alpha-glucosidase [Paenibacillus phyllosphaerae]
MPRDLPIGNGNLLINYDARYNLREIYYPYVGLENHTLGNCCRFGVWTPEGFSWLDDPAMKTEALYQEDTLVTKAISRHDRLGFELIIEDAVDAHTDCMIRKVTVRNLLPQSREFRLYFHLDLEIYGSAIGDTAYFDPDLHSLVFYKRNRYFSLSCQPEGAEGPDPSSFTTGKKRSSGMEGTWKDAEDGQLGRNPITQGSVDGTIEMTLHASGSQEAVGWFWIGLAKSEKELRRREREIRSESASRMLERTMAYWREWVQQDQHDLSELDPKLASLYKRSLLIIRTHFDNRGAITAANDSDILKFARDSYSYMWPRDGALIAHALDRSGYSDLTSRFVAFCEKALTEDGYMMHKYNPDGSPGSSWHPWINEHDEKQFPIQEDETSLVLYSMWHHYQMAGTLSESKKTYEEFVIPAADFLIRYRGATGLPLPSYDLWEERYGVHAFTVATVYAGLLAASNFAKFHGDSVRTIYYRDTAASVKKAVEEQMYSKELGRFLRALYWNSEKASFEPDLKLDASMYGLHDFGMFQPDDPRIVKMMQDMYLALSVKTEVGGLARYENDYYHQISQDIQRIPGNPWIICSLWYAEWQLATAKSEDDLKPALQWLYWAHGHALPSGVMAEQVHPTTGDPLSVSPLAWSHATYVKVVQEYIARSKEIHGEQGDKRKTDVSDEQILTAAVH